jgi:hypothetical protein
MRYVRREAGSSRRCGPESWPDRCLFVAGSAYDLIATTKLGLAIYWHDRIGMEVPGEMPHPLVHERTLACLTGCLGIT